MLNDVLCIVSDQSMLSAVLVWKSNAVFKLRCVSSWGENGDASNTSVWLRMVA